MVGGRRCVCLPFGLKHLLLTRSRLAVPLHLAPRVDRHFPESQLPFLRYDLPRLVHALLPLPMMCAAPVALPFPSPGPLTSDMHIRSSYARPTRAKHVDWNVQPRNLLSVARRPCLSVRKRQHCRQLWAPIVSTADRAEVCRRRLCSYVRHRKALKPDACDCRPPRLLLTSVPYASLRQCYASRSRTMGTCLNSLHLQFVGGPRHLHETERDEGRLG